MLKLTISTKPMKGAQLALIKNNSICEDKNFLTYYDGNNFLEITNS